MELDFEIDKITESIEDAETGESLDTLAIPFTKEDLEETIIAIDTKEKLDWLLNGLEDGEIQLVSRELTKEDEAEISRAIAEYRATHPKAPAQEAILA